MKLKDKRALITGGAMGIGFATTKRLLNEGCTVTIWDLNETALNEARANFKNYIDKLFLYQCDVTDKERVLELAKQIKKDMGGVDILINNAGHVKGGFLTDLPDEVWEKTVDVNLTSLIFITKVFLKGMYEQSYGHVVNISSASSTLGVPELSVYTATKWAVWGFTEIMRFEAINKGKPNVKFSSIHPSYIVTGMFEGAKLGFLGNLIVPLVKNHDVIAKAIVDDALKKEKYAIKRPRSVRLAILLRGILPDKVYQKMLLIMGVHKSMSGWKGRENK